MNMHFWAVQAVKVSQYSTAPVGKILACIWAGWWGVTEQDIHAIPGAEATAQQYRTPPQELGLGFGFVVQTSLAVVVPKAASPARNSDSSHI